MSISCPITKPIPVLFPGRALNVIVRQAGLKNTHYNCDGYFIFVRVAGNFMNLKQISYFIKIAELRSFTLAANALYVSQPALSRQMSQLEDEIGTALFIRSDKGLKLTDAGVLLRQRAPTILSDVAQLRNDLQTAYSQAPAGVLSVGIGMSLRDILTVPVISGFQQEYPNVALDILESVTGPLIEDIKSGNIDCALVFELDPSAQVIAEPFVKERLFLVGPPDADFRNRTTMKAEEIFENALISTKADNPIRKKIEAIAQDFSKEPKIAFETNAVSTMVSCVVLGGYYSVLPYSSICKAVQESKVVAVPVEDLTLDWTFVYSKSFGLSLAAKVFRDFLFAQAESTIASGSWPFTEALFTRRLSPQESAEDKK